MVLFLLLSVPCVYLLGLQFSGALTDYGRLVRNPLVIGAATFFLYALLDNVTSALFSDLYRWQDAFLASALEDQVLPVVAAFVFFLVFFRKILTLPVLSQQIILFSFLAGFFSLLNVRDLVVQINLLDPVDLFYRPIGRTVLLVLVPWLFVSVQSYFNSRIILISIVGVVHLLIAFSCAAQHMNMPYLAGGLMVVPVFSTIFLLLSGQRSIPFFNKVFRA